MKFDGLASTNFTIAKYLAQKNEVYYVEQPYTLADYWKLDKNDPSYTIRKPAYKNNSNGLLAEKLDGVNLVVTKPTLPVNFLPKGKIFTFFNRINEHLIACRINKIIHEKGIKDYILINAFDFRCPSITRFLSPKLFVYHCVDPIVGNYNLRHGPAAEREIIDRADLVICTSKALADEKIKQNPNTYFVPNGADIVKYQTYGTQNTHPALKAINKPIVGYIGAIERRMDYQIIKQVAEKNTHVNFVFVGPQHAEDIPKWFYQTKNIHVLASIPYHEVSEMINGFDICMIPFKKDEVSNTIFPLKLFEYLGMGKPVICTDFNADLSAFANGEVVSYVADEAAFSTAILQLLNHNSPELEQKRKAIAANNTWQDRSDRISKILNEWYNR